MYRSFIGKLLLVFIALSVALLSGCSAVFPQPTATPTATNTPEPSPTPLPTDTPPPPTPTEEPTLLPTNTPFPTLPPPAAATPTIAGKPIYIYYVKREQKVCQELVPITVNVSRQNVTEKDVEAALRALFSFHSLQFGDSYNFLYLSRLSVVSANFEGGGRLVVDLKGELVVPQDKICGNTSDPNAGWIHRQIIATIRQFPGVSGNPSINLNGVGIKNYLPGL